MSTAAVRSGDPTPAEALPRPLPASLSQPRETSSASPPISSVLARSRRYDVSLLFALAGIEVAWVALLAFVILALAR